MSRELSGKQKALRWIRRLMLALAVLAVLAWVAPYLVPADMLRNHVQRQIAQAVTGRVTVSSAHFSWCTGFTIEDVTIDDRQQGGLRVQVRNVSVPIEPFRLLFAKEIGLVQLQGVDVVADASSPLRSPLAAPMPEGGVRIDRLDLADAHVTVAWADGAATRLTIPHLSLDVDPRTVTVAWSGTGKASYTPHGPDEKPHDAGRFGASGRLQIAEQGGQTCYSGTVEFAWQDLQLTALRLDQAPNLSLDKLAGRSSGKLNLQVFPDFHFDGRLRTQVRQVHLLTTGSAEPSYIDDLGIALAGDYDPLTGRFNLEALDLTSPVLSLASSLAGLFEPAGVSLTEVNLSGQFRTDLAAQQVPALAERLSLEGELSGPCRFEAHWRNDDVLEHVKIQVDASDVSLHVPNAVAKPAGEPLSLEVALNADPQSWPWMQVHRLQFRFADLELSGSGRLPRVRAGERFEWWLQSVRRLAEFDLALKIPRLQRLAQVLPIAAPPLEQLEATGPLDLHVAYEGQRDWAQAAARIELGPSSNLTVGRYFVKPTRRQVQLDVKARWPWLDPAPALWLEFRLAAEPLVFENTQHPVKIVWSFHEGGDSPELDLVLDVPVAIRNPARLADFSPALAERLNPSHQFTGQSEFRLQGSNRLACRDGQWQLLLSRMAFAADADEAGIRVADAFVKRPGTPLAANGQLRYDGGRLDLDGELNFKSLHSRVAFQRTFGPEPTAAGRYQVRLDEARGLLESLPLVQQHLPNGLQIAGGLAAAIDWQTGPDGGRVGWTVDASQLGLEADERTLKRPGVRCSLDGLFELSEPAEGVQEHRLSKASLHYGESFVKVASGRARLEAIAPRHWLAVVGLGPWLAWRHSPLQHAELEVSGRLAVDPDLQALSDRLLQWSRTHQAAGAIDFAARGRFEDGLLTAQLRADAAPFGFAWKNALHKNPGTPASARLGLSLWADSQQNAYYSQVEPLELTFGPASLKTDGHLNLRWGLGQIPEILDGRLAIEIPPVDLAELAAVSPRLAALRASGRPAALLNADWRDGRLMIAPSRIDLHEVSMTADGQPLTLDGGLTFSSHHLDCRRLTVSDDRSDLSVVADLMLQPGADPNDPGRMFGSAEITSRYLDVDRLATTAQSVLKTLLPELNVPPTQTAPAADPWIVRHRRTVDQIRRFLAGSAALLAFQTDRLRRIEPRSNAEQTIGDLAVSLDVSRNAEDVPQAVLQFHGDLNDGAINGRFTAVLDDPNPPLDLQSQLVEVTVGPSIQPQIEDFFPGLTVNGTFSDDSDEQARLFGWPNDIDPNRIVGQGRMAFTDGHLEGKAAPDWVTQIFPGLNFTRYNFAKLINWYTKFADGRVHNNMIFRGWPWNIYMEGDSLPDKTVRYQVGVDLMARYESKFWSSAGQGRIPLFSTSGRIENGKLLDQNLEYVPLSTIYGLLVKTNPLATAYYALKKQLDKPQ